MLQIVVAAMTVGCILFLAVAIVALGRPSELTSLSVVTCACLAVAAVLVGARAIIPGIIVAKARRKIRQDTWVAPSGNLSTLFHDQAEQNGDVVKLAQLLMMRTILAAAMLESAVFILLVAYMIERSPLSLVSAIVLIVALAAHVPTRSRIAGWISDQMRLLDEERSLS